MKLSERILNHIKLSEAISIDDLDSPETMKLHQNMIENKPFLKKVYLDFYNEFKKSIQKVPNGPRVEIGSGGGCIKEVMPEIITSDVCASPGVDKVFSAMDMPFEDNTVSAFMMLNVLHHIQDPSAFFDEARRCLVDGGVVVMIEPNHCLWTSFLGRLLPLGHSCDPDAGWKLSGGGRYSEENDAVPWIIFRRDRELFEKKFPELKINKLKPMAPFRYLISGGLSFKQLLPTSFYGAVKFFENILSPLNKYLGRSMFIELEKVKPN